ncbi:uncharacterized protein LOC131892250 isoform X2 [Tigriopus californicus]|nr:uncharacterized protein LOC131892250 isoform X2 [Tigriopus californicus]
MVGTEVLLPAAEIRFDFFIRYELDYLFGGTTALAAAIAGNNAAAQALQTAEQAVEAAAGKKKRSVTGEGFASIFGRSFDNVLTRTLADDQVSILKRIEDGLKNGGLPGRDCVLRTICDLKETPIHEWSLVGEMISTLFFPKSDDHSELADYKEAARVGESETEECWSVYSKCPLSIFNVIPDIYTKDHKFNVSYDNFDAGSTNSFTKDDFADLPKSFPTEDAHKINLDFDFT